MDNSFMVVAGFFFEKIVKSDFGKPFLRVIDLKNEEQRAQYVVLENEFLEKVSTFSDKTRYDKLQQLLVTNAEEIREEFNAQMDKHHNN